MHAQEADTVLVGKFPSFSPQVTTEVFDHLSSTNNNNNNNMTNRAILKPINVNRRCGYQLSNEHKSAIVASRAGGLWWKEVASQHSVGISTAQYVFATYTTTKTVNPKPRKGRPKG